MLTTRSTRTDRRRGIVLLVVMAMLALFAVVALSFVYYAEAEATASRYANQAQTQAQADVDPELLLSYFLSQLIYDTDNVYSAMRGHSLARNMYGFNPNDWNVTPYSGVGRLRYDVTYAMVEPNASNPPRQAAVNNMVLVNYTNYSGNPAGVRYPERDKNTKYVGGNVHWTYPDLNNMFLAAVTGDGDVLIPSFHRPWNGGQLTPAGDPAVSADPWAKFMCLRPHSGYHTDFLSPDWDGGGDVKNLEWGKGTIIGGSFGRNVGAHVNNDSIWMDLAFPVLTAPNGKRYKALFAPLIVDLDNKINLYAHGNIMSGNVTSNMGWGPWEANLSKVLNGLPPPNPLAPPQPPTEWLTLFQGSSIARYGSAPNAQPEGTVQSPLYNNKASPTTQVLPPYYSKIDFGGALGGKRNYPGSQGVGSNIQTYPVYPANWDNAMANETTNHPAGYTPFVKGNVNNRAALVMSQIEALYRYQGTGAPAFTSDLLAQLQANMQNPRTRWLSTLRSADLDRPGLVPYNAVNTTAPTNTPSYQYYAFKNYPSIPGSGTPPSATSPGEIKFPPAVPTPTGEFDATSLRSNVFNKTGNQLRVLLNRDLTPYPDPTNPVQDPLAIAKAVKDRQDMARELYDMLIRLTGARDPNLVAGMDQTGTEYQASRWLAQVAVNIVDFIDEDDYMTPFQWNKTSAPNEWLFGTELAHLLLNEVYAQVDNDASDPGVWNNAVNSRKVTSPANPPYNYRVNFWIELHNPMIATPAQPPGVASYPRNGGKVLLSRPVPAPENFRNEYRVVVTPAANFNKDDPTNTIGKFKTRQPEDLADPKMPIQSVPSPANTPPPPRSSVTLNFPAGADFVDVAPPGTYGPVAVATAKGFYVLGPKPPASNVVGSVGKQFVKDANNLERNPGITVSAQFPELSLPFLLPTDRLPATPQSQAPYGVFLQRLANPSLPYQNDLTKNQDPTLPNYQPYNPYVTVDYWNGIGVDTQSVGVQPRSALHMAVAYDSAGPFPQPAGPKQPPVQGPTQPPAPGQGPLFWTSMGRRQPYLGYEAFWTPQTILNNPPLSQPKHTFWRHNGTGGAIPTTSNTLMVPFSWPVHLDRRLVNPLELVNVSCYRPWEFTQYFGKSVDHRDPWDKQETVLYRLLEVVQTSNFTPQLQAQAQGTISGGRLAGKININTVWDQEIFDALVDDVNNFNPNPPAGRPPNVKLWKTFLDSRTPGLATQVPPNTGPITIIGVVGPTDEIVSAESPSYPLNRPFKSLNVGVYSAISPQNPLSGDKQYPNGLGLDNTIFRNIVGTQTGIFEQTDTSTYVGRTLPFKKFELLSKMYNNLTLRSNVFAVWLTVGFFEVTDESVYPVKLGKEIGRAENRHVRHRMFAVIDRTNLITSNLQTNVMTGVNKGVGQKVLLRNLTFNLAVPGQVSVTTRIAPGMRLVFDGPYNPAATSPSEIVTIDEVDYTLNQITATFQKAHGVGAIVAAFSPIPATPGPPSIPNSVLGNPGPQEGPFVVPANSPVIPPFSVRENTLVVPHFSIIQ